MGATRPKPQASEETLRFPLDRARGRLSLAIDRGEAASEVSRGLAELAAAHESPLLIIASRPRLATSLRTARLLGMEPRVIAPAGQPGIPARLTLSLPLRGALGTSARAAAVAYVAAFAGAGQSDGPSGARLAEAVGRSATRLGNAFTFEALARDLESGAAAGRGKPTAGRLMALHEAEQQASVFTTPVPWSRVLAPSPRGRPAAVWVDLTSLSPESAEVVGGLALASVAATAAEWGPALNGRPPVVLAHGVASQVGAFALERLLGASPPTPLFGLYVEDSAGAADGLALPGVPSAVVERGGLTFDGIDARLPLPDAVGAAEPLTQTERESLTPRTLRERVVGAGEGDDEPEGEGDAGTARGRASSQALQHASGDLGKIARQGIRPPKKRTAQGQGDYEAGDFDLG